MIQSNLIQTINKVAYVLGIHKRSLVKY